MKTNNLRLASAAAAMLSTAVPAAAHEARHGAITIAHPFVAANPACKAGPLRGYLLLIVNEGAQADRLVSGELKSGARGTLVKFNREQGQPSSTPLTGGLEIPAGGKATLMTPDHAIEFARPKTQPAEGSMLPGTLRFERAGAVPVQFMVEATHRSADANADACGNSAPEQKHKH